jgi:hypothetical protein
LGEFCCELSQAMFVTPGVAKTLARCGGSRDVWTRGVLPTLQGRKAQLDVHLIRSSEIVDRRKLPEGPEQELCVVGWSEAKRDGRCALQWFARRTNDQELSDRAILHPKAISGEQSE